MENNKSEGKNAAIATEVMAAVSTADKKTTPPSQGALASEIQEEKKNAAPKKAPAKKTAAPKKTAAKKTEPKASVFIEYSGRQVEAAKVLEAAKKDFLSKHQDAAIKTVDVYVKPEENAAYYAVNGEGSEQFKVML